MIAHTAASPDPRLVLLVDDDRDTREMYAMCLVASGFRVEQAASARQALDRIQALGPDIIVTDMALPGMDGLAFALEVRRRPGLERVPILAVTGYTIDEDTDARIREADIAGVLVKPCEPDRLADEIRTVLASSPAA